MDKNESVVAKILQLNGCSVEKIPESEVPGEKRPDFHVDLNGDKYVIEVKTKDLPEDETDRMWEELSKEDVVSGSTPMGRENKYSRRIKDSVEQLKSCEKEGFKLSWLHNVGLEASNHKDKFKYALYGVQMLVDFSPGGMAKECYFFTQSEFYTHKNVLDGAIVTEENGGGIELEMYLNPLSENYEKLKNSSLSKVFADKSTLVDPLLLDKQGQIFYADEDAGSNTRELIESMKAKYGCKELIIMPMKSITVRKGLFLTK